MDLLLSQYCVDGFEALSEYVGCLKLESLRDLCVEDFCACFPEKLRLTALVFFEETSKRLPKPLGGRINMSADGTVMKISQLMGERFSLEGHRQLKDDVKDVHALPDFVRQQVKVVDLSGGFLYDEDAAMVLELARAFPNMTTLKLAENRLHGRGDGESQIEAFFDAVCKEMPQTMFIDVCRNPLVTLDSKGLFARWAATHKHIFEKLIWIQEAHVLAQDITWTSFLTAHFDAPDAIYKLHKVYYAHNC